MMRQLAHHICGASINFYASPLPPGQASMIMCTAKLGFMKAKEDLYISFQSHGDYMYRFKWHCTLLLAHN